MEKTHLMQCYLEKRIICVWFHLVLKTSAAFVVCKTLTKIEVLFAYDRTYLAASYLTSDKRSIGIWFKENFPEFNIVT